MFGHHDDKQPQSASGDAPADTDTAGAIQETRGDVNDQATQAPAQPTADNNGTPDPGVVEPDQVDQQPDTNAPLPHENGAPAPVWQHPGATLDKDKEEDQGQISDIISPAGGFPKRPSYQYPSGVEPKNTQNFADDPATRELIDVKEHALNDLAPLLDKLDLPPEEKFRAIMMILQTNDDKALVKAAYEAAHAIEDDETRAKALFTIVNEVDYFTNPHDNTSDQEDN